MNLITNKKISPKGQLNTTDIKKLVRDTAIFFAAPALMYLGQLTGTLNQNHVILVHDLVPNVMTIGAMEGWAIGIAINFFLKLNNGKQ